MNYESSNGCLPGGSYSGSTGINPPHWSTYPENFSCFVRMLPYFEQSPMYNATNFNLCSSDIANLTICGVQVNSLICPSDTRNETIRSSRNAGFDRGVTPGWSFNEILSRCPPETGPSIHQLRRECRYIYLRLHEPDADVDPAHSSTA